VAGRLVELTGYLGQFQAIVEVEGKRLDLADYLGKHKRRFDLILDLADPPYFKQALPPLGYYAPGGDPDALHRALRELPDRVGEFEKPKYFNYDPSICAHGASGLTGCSRCVGACPTLAITSIGEQVAVDPYLCQGGGICATACPTGAFTYAYPQGRDLLACVRSLLEAFRQAGGTTPCLLFHDVELGAQMLEAIASRMPENLIPVPVEEVGSLGMEVCLASLAYGAGQVNLLATAATPPSVSQEIEAQLSYTGALTNGMGYPQNWARLLTSESEAALLRALNDCPPDPKLTPARFAAFQEKRTTLRYALDYLFEQAPAPQARVDLPEGAPFGDIRVDREACTLCMACVSVCPAAALADGGDAPRLNFIEDNCVQCGLCATACPEAAIALMPCFTYEWEVRRVQRTLNEEQPFNCVNCGKPFATRKMMDRMAAKLQSHWMFQKPEAMRRLQMCEDCRVKQVFAQEGGLDLGPKTR
jgi:ferredoxin